MYKVYLAAPFADLALMPEREAQVEAAGLEITHKWWNMEIGQSYNSPPRDILRWALQDFKGAATAEGLILFSTGFSEGKAVEQGIALALGIPIIAIGTLGEFRNVFHYLPDYVWVTSLQEAIAECLNTGVSTPAPTSV